MRTAQIDGATVMGVAQGTMEESIMDHGRITNNNLSDYKVPTISEIPVLKIVLVQSRWRCRAR